MKTVKEDRLGKQGAFALLSMNKAGPAQHRFPLEEGLKDLGLSLAALTMELRTEGKCSKVIPARITEDKLVLVFPETTREVAAEITGRLQAACDQRAVMAGRPKPSFNLTVIAYDGSGTKLTAFLRLLFSQFILSVPSQEDWLASTEGLLTGLATHIAESFTLLDTAQKLALSDDVSGLPNHRAAQTVLGEKFNYSLKKQAPFSILFIDGDNLRQYNSISYQKGNSMIRRLGEIIASQLRRGDFLARWFSGDEFLVVLPGADRFEAYRVGERLRVLVEETTRDWLFPITISVGIASFPEDGNTLEALLQKAEEANALAKRSGKNQVCEAGTPYPAQGSGLYQPRSNYN
ncbi:MAG: GGDEF domain-containing protein [Firmicutes bacterium]|nr:GGDEF domain-containing protein [Bacillota bacterium]